MRIDGAKVVMIWENGKQTELGTFEITADDIAEIKQSARFRWFRHRLGWELVRKGFWIMFQWRKWKCD